MGDSIQARPTMVRWRIVALLMGCVALGHFNRISMSVAGTEHIMREYDVDEWLMGTVYSAFLLTYTLCMTPGGWFSDRFGIRVALMVVCFGSALFAALTGATGLLFSSAALLIPALLVVRSAMGIVNAPLHPAGARAVASWMPPAGRSGANGLVVGAFSVGTAASYLLFGRMMEWYSWPGAFLVAAVVTGGFSIIWTIYAANHPHEHPSVNAQERTLIEGDALPASAKSQSRETEQTPAGVLTLLTNRSLICVTLSYGAVSYMQYLFFYWIQHYFGTVMGLGKEVGRYGSTGMSLALGVGMIGGGWLADRVRRHYGPHRNRSLVPVTGMVVCALAVIAGLAVPVPEPAAENGAAAAMETASAGQARLSTEAAWIIGFFALAMLALGTNEGAFWTAATELGGPRGATAAGILNTGGNGGGFLAPIVTPLVSKAFDWKAGIGLASLVCLAGAALWHWVDLRDNSEVEKS